VVSEPVVPRPAHPGPPVARLPRAIAEAIEAQARAEYPLEACGLVAGSGYAASGGEALRYVACRNAASSPVRYTVHPDDLYRVSVDTDDADEVIWAIVHSHVRSPAVPSPTDVGLAFYPDALYVLISLAEVPALRAWRIVDGSIHEVGLELG
jgi:proteasome lid subunit RPN8/RPN11